MGKAETNRGVLSIRIDGLSVHVHVSITLLVPASDHDFICRFNEGKPRLHYISEYNNRFEIVSGI